MLRAVRFGSSQQQRRPRSKVVKIKIISMGETCVGKSCLIKRYCEGKFVSKYIATIGVDYGVKPIEYGEYEVRMNVWDLAGGSEYYDIRTEFYRDAQAGLLVYDTTSRASFEVLDKWVKESAEFGAGNMIVIVVGTKCDVPSRKVSSEEGREWATSRGFLFFEVSAASGQHVVPLFSTLFARVLATTQGVSSMLLSSAAQLAAEHRQIEGIEWNV